MSEANKSVSRRGFLKLPALPVSVRLSVQKFSRNQMTPTGKKNNRHQPLELPKRKLGKTGVEISCSRGGCCL